MEYLGLLVLVASAVVLLEQWRRKADARRAKPATNEELARTEATAPSAGAPQGAAGTPPATDPSSSESTSSRLRALGIAIASFAEHASHPRELADIKEFREAVALLASADTPLELVLQYATGANWTLAAAALEALCDRADRDQAMAPMQSELPEIPPWALYYAFRYFCSVSSRPPVGASVLFATEWWLKHGLTPDLLRDYFKRRDELGDEADFGDLLRTTSGWDAGRVHSLLSRVQHPSARRLSELLRDWQLRTLDRAFLQTCGRLWSEDDADVLIEHDALRVPLAEAEAGICHKPPRSVLVVAESRAGKTSFLRLLARRLSAKGWVVFEAGAADLMAGQVYIGQLEDRIKRLVRELHADKRVLWYVPDFRQIATSGTHQGQTATVLDQVLHAVVSGQLVIASETTPAALTALLQLRPVLRSTFDVVRLRTLSDAEVEALAHGLVELVRGRFPLEVDDAAIAAGMQLSRQFLATMHMPGAVLDLLKLAVNRSVANEEPRLTTGSLLETLSQLTGLPRSILDDGERVELESIERFFTARVIGQPEAVRATIERIAMLKAGLTDPAKPIGIFLFAGPTGTGKTELARTLAEFLFGSVERMIRLDMSEFQTPDSTRKILGDGGAETQSLALRVRKQPFCLILLDEFEKSHSNIWDLFLQVFDAGRLTDAAGQTVDFRHSIIILTSNLGATRHLSSGLGFTPQANAFSHEQVLHAVAQNFRPEFVNRLDRVIVFRPLTRELMRGILQKELKNVLERRGLRNREWAVEWEPSALEFLLDKGFSPEMGARPLKRAIDQYLLAPLAATIVEHRAPAGEQFLFVRAAGDAIQVEFVDPDVEPEAAVTASASSAPVPASLPALILHPNGTAAEREALQRRLEETEARLTSSEWEARKQTLTIAMQDVTFWDRPDRHEVLARYALMDRVRAATAGARSLERRLGRTTTHGGRSSRELVSRLALQLHLIALGIDDASSGAPVEVILSAQPALESGTDSQAARAWAEKLRAMYRRWGARRNMQVQEVMPGGSAGPMLLVLGFGAWRTLEKEVGLHVLEAENPPDGPGRAVARVKIAERPLDDSTSSRGSHGSLAALLDRTPPSHQVVRRYRLDGSPLVRDARQGWRTGRVDAVLAGDFDLLAQIADTPA